MTSAVEFVCHVRVTGPNAREHHFTRKRRVTMERCAVQGALLLQRGVDWRRGLQPPYAVTMTRIGKRDLDTDNLQGAMKAIRDQVARELGLGDSPRDPIEWRYAQRRGAEYAVEVRIEMVPNNAAKAAGGTNGH